MDRRHGKALQNGMRKNIPGIAPKFQEWLDGKLQDIATSGYTIILQTSESVVGALYTTTDSGWVKTYLNNQLWVVDPVIRYAYSEVGAASFREIMARYPETDAYIVELSRKFGLKYGTAAVRRRADRTKCCLVACRPDRDHTPAEIEQLQFLLRAIIARLDDRMGLSPDDLAMLNLLSQGYDQETIAYRMRVSRDAVKKRVDRVRRKMCARNTTHAVSLALKNNLLG